ncbi:hypothetical protein NM688_g8317 [Phlebia brevispora]|uniref:Uncharacterized protein n=1 Tax=Phlebia brevispora TaxID=194682 RepID=A0ACC1RUU9_9APHY|nr:hypothetical protein NM688_g8317 [Phlebia brevispora]
MDPSEPTSFNHRALKLSTGHTYHFVDQLPADYESATTTNLVLIHGFPDFWYGWRYQIKPLVDRGYRVIVPDMLGYGGTDKPVDPVEYSYSKLSNDLVALLDALDIPKAVFIGHDWGSLTAQRVVLFHPDRVLALAILAVAYWPPSRVYVPLEEFVKQEPSWGYMLYFASDQSTKDIDSNPRRFFDTVYRTPGSQDTSIVKGGGMQAAITGEASKEGREHLFNEQVMAYYLENFKSMHGPLNYYRTTKYRYEEEKDLPVSPPPDLPVLFIGGSKDPTSLPSLVDHAKSYVPQLESEMFDDSHWLMIGESKDAVTERIATWLEQI